MQLFKSKKVGARIIVASNGGEFSTIADAISNASAGDTIEVAPGTYTLTATATIPDDVSLEGSGRDKTLIQYAGASGNTSVLILGTNTVLRDVYVKCTTTTGYGAIVVPGTENGTVIDGCKLEGRIALNYSTSADATAEYEHRFRDCEFVGYRDTVKITGDNQTYNPLARGYDSYATCVNDGTVTPDATVAATESTGGARVYNVGRGKMYLYNCQGVATASHNYAGSNARGALATNATNGGTLYAKHCYFEGTSTHSSSESAGVKVDAAGGAAYLHHSECKSTGGTNSDIHQSAGTLEAHNCVWSTAAGAITFNPYVEYVDNCGYGLANTLTFGAANREFYTKVAVTAPIRAAKIRIKVDTAEADKRADVALYAGSTLVEAVDGSAANLGATGVKTFSLTTKWLNPGVYWLAVKSDSTTAKLSGAAAMGTLRGATKEQAGYFSGDGTFPATLPTMTAGLQNIPAITLCKS